MDLPDWMWESAFQRITTRLADDIPFMTAVRLDLAIHNQPHNHLSQHPGELCACQHPVQDHQVDDGVVGPCLDCNCPQFTDEMAGWPPIL